MLSERSSCRRVKSISSSIDAAIVAAERRIDRDRDGVSTLSA
jgi:hypothetical protein